GDRQAQLVRTIPASQSRRPEHAALALAAAWEHLLDLAQRERRIAEGLEFGEGIAGRTVLGALPTKDLALCIDDAAAGDVAGAGELWKSLRLGVGLPTLQC